MKIAMAQMRVVWGDAEANLARAAERIGESAKRGAEVVVLPECLDLGWTCPAARDRAESIPGPSSDALAAAAHESDLWVVAGLTERAGDIIFNAAVLLSPDGEIALRHRKITILEITQDLYHVGDSLGVAETPLGTIGLNICADNFPDSLSLGHSLARMGAQAILSPCAWAVPPDHDEAQSPCGMTWVGSFTTLARLHDVAVVGVSNVGRVVGGLWDQHRCIGKSLAVAPGGEVIEHMPFGEDAEALAVVDIELTPRDVRGEAIARRLRERGYVGP